MKKILDWDKYIETAADMVAEGIVMLKNENGALPLDKESEVAVFGRIQLHYYKSGTGSGGMVNVSKVTGVVDGLIESGIKVNSKLLEIYKKWDSENPYDLGSGWGEEPWSQQEMHIENELAEEISKVCSTAIVIIGRSSGEEHDNTMSEGSYLLTAEEKDMLKKVRDNFSKVIVLLNVGNIIDMKYIEEINPDSILYVWQGGMVGGIGTASILTGNVSPSGKMTDTIAYSVSDYPSDPYFGDNDRNIYSEDIYVGYRYFETFSKDKVIYPFGFGLSYTDFNVRTDSIREKEEAVTISVTVKNTGSFPGKEVVQVYCEAPQGKLGKPARVLCGFKKTKKLDPNEHETIEIGIPFAEIASYDDSGVTGHPFCYVLEAGNYNFLVGTDVRNAVTVYTASIPETVVIKSLCQALAPVIPFKRMKPVLSQNGYKPEMECAPMSKVNEHERRLGSIPDEIPYTGDKGIKLADVLSGKNTMEEFIAQLSDYDLSCIIRGEGMGSPKVTPGTASAFGGVSKNLVNFGIPAGCCDDGPSGMRLDCGTKAFSLPNGTLIASAFNPELTEELFYLLGLEMTVNNVDCLLGPGINIHRHPLNGRNFEYFSEDPYLTGKTASAVLKGLKTAGVSGTIKHFCGNNQETRRHFLDTVVSERALREIYLKGFEIAVKEGYADSIMTTYGAVNGLWTAGNYDLNTTILRKEWGFTGFVMTDWWANINERGESCDKTNLAAMAAAQNDVYMVCADGSENDDNTLKALESGKLKRSELQRNAANICRYLMHTNALKRLCGTFEPVTVINRPESDTDSDEPVVFYDIDNNLTLSLDDIETVKGTSYSFALTVMNPGYYKVTLTASSSQSELAQIPVTLFCMGTAYGTFTWNGTGGKSVSFSKTIPMFSRFTAIRLYFAQNGLDMHSITFEKTDKDVNIETL